LGEGWVLTEGVSSTDIARILGEAADVTTRINLLLAEVTEVVQVLRAGQGTAGKLLNDPELYDVASDTARALAVTAGELSGTAKRFNKLGQQLQKDLLEGDGTLQRLTGNPEPFERLNSSMAHLDAVLAKLEAGEGSLGKLLNDETTTEELTGLIADIRSLVQKIEAEPKKYLHFTVF
jgi:phospholipid/cholesterol/gamma-HCH transport system substrate-binding protein